MVVLRAELDPARGETVRNALDAMIDEQWRAAHPDREPTLAERPAHGQRMADALVAICERGLGGGKAAKTTSRPGRAQALVLLDYQTLLAGLHDHSVCETSWGAPLAPETARRLLCDAGIFPAVLGGNGEVLDLGRSRRLASDAQRRAVIARDRRCVFGCNTPPAWCKVHHAKPWTAGGRTDLRNLCLLCDQHHHLVHEGGWTINPTDNGFQIRRPDASLFKRGP